MSVPDSLLFQVETNTQQISSLDERLNTVEAQLSQQVGTTSPPPSSNIDPLVEAAMNAASEAQAKLQLVEEELQIVIEAMNAGDSELAIQSTANANSSSLTAAARANEANAVLDQAQSVLENAGSPQEQANAQSTLMTVQVQVNIAEEAAAAAAEAANEALQLSQSVTPDWLLAHYAETSPAPLLSPVNMGSTIIKNGPWRKTLYGTTGNPNSELQFPPEVHAGGNDVKKAYCESITNPNSQNAIPSPDGNNYVGFSWHPAWGGGGCQLFTSEAINEDGSPNTQVAPGWTTVYFPEANIEPFTGDIYNTVRSNRKLFYFLVICLLIFVFYLVNKKRLKKLIKKMIKK